jgi:hypothetical protein
MTKKVNALSLRHPWPEAVNIFSMIADNSKNNSDLANKKSARPGRKVT